jgi:hypothetical protein
MKPAAFRKLFLRKCGRLTQRSHRSTQRNMVGRNLSLLAAAHDCARQPIARGPPLHVLAWPIGGAVILIVCNNDLVMPTLGEALNDRAELQKRIAQLNERLRANVLVQEGDPPAESPEELLAELDRACDELEALMARINQTNAASKLPSGGTVTEALARRDVLAMRTSAIRSAIKEATDRGAFGRYSRSEIRVVRQIEVAPLQRQADALAKARRELETELQQHNWTTALIE